jgi:protein-disulfide isomerase
MKGALDEASVAASAATLDRLDQGAWQACLTTPGPVARVKADLDLALALGIGATPTFVVNGRVVVGAVPEATLTAAIDDALAAAKASGVAKDAYYDQVVLGLRP